MSRKTSVQENGSSQTYPPGITHITVGGFKSISREQTIAVRHLTVLAGANSSGKSSIMQPLLLMKQTLEATFDPGALLLNGPNAKFTSFDQVLSTTGRGERAKDFLVGIKATELEDQLSQDGDFYQTPLTSSLQIRFGKSLQSGFTVQEMSFSDDYQEQPFRLIPEMSEKEILSVLPDIIRDEVAKELKKVATASTSPQHLRIVRERCYLKIESIHKPNSPLLFYFPPDSFQLAGEDFSPYIQGIIHLPGLRGNPERTYPVTAVGSAFPGTFENYTASIIARWQAERKDDRIARLSESLERLGLTWKVAANRLNDTQVELQVGRLARAERKGGRDLVNIADVGFGVSQTLPVLVALLAARPGQLVYLEQPEIHLHPRAQTAMAQVLADAANRGVRVVVETHSSLLLLGIQTLVAEGKLSPDKVKLHWFTRRNDGTTDIKSNDLDESGAFGDWPEDFAEVEMQAENRYLDAAEARHFTH